ncbi:MAG: hydrogenase expression/synthesis HypA [Acidimicrobiaceae bacterium]|nr:hydrogenase expression/synthesis HypA [Acidimicrobiaceae bacterium]
MHEMSYCEGVVEAVERRAGTRRVARVRVRIGTVHRVVPAAFQQSFEMVAAGGPAADAETEVVTIPISAVCRECGERFTSEDPAPSCVACGSLHVDASGGDEVILESIEYRPEPGPEDGDAQAEPTDEVVARHVHATDDEQQAGIGPRGW